MAQTRSTASRGWPRRCDLWVISDEVYDSAGLDGRHLPFAARPGMAARTLTVGSMSKSHAMTGSRLGWVAGPADVPSPT
jgi:arginine:pyruvate transaminase